ncbi:hypothetical protein AGLY_005460 [Aphis glycines]|uniref:Uncharacterized protein n=1 Tax=Aphis glycines TaxID=307491 RepID=A0A6G0TU25_APHGL|nr:hypothetical protein AGLY_005460 [Aphis glycines]
MSTVKFYRSELLKFPNHNATTKFTITQYLVVTPENPVMNYDSDLWLIYFNKFIFYVFLIHSILGSLKYCSLVYFLGSTGGWSPINLYAIEEKWYFKSSLNFCWQFANNSSCGDYNSWRLLLKFCFLKSTLLIMIYFYPVQYSYIKLTGFIDHFTKRSLLNNNSPGSAAIAVSGAFQIWFILFGVKCIVKIGINDLWLD